MTTAEQITAKIDTLPTDTLVDICCSLMNDFRDGSDAVFSAALAECQRRMSSAEFLAFCSKMGAAA